MNSLSDLIRSAVKVPDLVFTVGIPGAGKSAWIHTMKGYVVINPDSIRAGLGDISDQTKNTQVWAIAKDKVREALSKGKNVILDATNLVSGYRKFFLEGLPDHNLKAKVFSVDPTEAKRRIKEDIEKGRQRAVVPDDVIDRMYEQFKETMDKGQLKEEGFEIIP